MFSNRKETAVLLAGDIVCFYAALFTTLFLRYQSIPSGKLLEIHVAPFTLLFGVWLLVFFIAGLYEKQTLVFKRRIFRFLWNAQVANSVIAVLFFYFLPFFAIAPKTNLFLDLALSFLLVLYWRQRAAALFRARRREQAVLVGSGAELRELESEINGNARYPLQFIETIDISASSTDSARADIRRAVGDGASVIVADFENDRIRPLLADLYNLLFSKVRLVQFDSVYEDIFDRIPLSIVGHTWFLENISAAPKRAYDILKRTMDIAVSALVGVASLVVYPLVVAAIKLDDGGPIFISQERIGQNGVLIRTYKFRSMERNEMDPTRPTANRVTRVGGFIRRMRIDELPQLWSVLIGTMSLIGPRPELPSAVILYEKSIPYYSVRHLIKPGLSGWAQIYGEHAHHGADVSKTENKLSYDLYYVKNRSLSLDIKIALRTIQTILSRSGI